MKFTFVFAILVANAAIAQEPKQPNVTIIGTTAIGKVEASMGSVFIQCREEIQPRRGTTNAGVSIYMFLPGQPETRQAVIPYDALQDLIDALKYMTALDKHATRLDEAGAEYRSYGILAAILPESRRKLVSGGAALTFLGETSYKIYLDGFEEFTKLLVDAKKKLDEARK